MDSLDVFHVDKPFPGSDEAVRSGCTCPIVDNGHGRGFLGDGRKFGWVLNGDCPIHGHRVEEMGA